MTSIAGGHRGEPTPRRLPKDARRRQLLETALAIVREEGADRLTLGRLATRAGVSKPVTYDHFATRSGLLIELYRWMDAEKVGAFENKMAHGERSVGETVDLLAAAYIDCAADKNGEVRAIGAALAGSAEKEAVYQELLDNAVRMFVAVLRPYASMADAELERRCVGLVGAGEALAAALVRGRSTEDEAVAEFGTLIRCGMQASTTR